MYQLGKILIHQRGAKTGNAGNLQRNACIPLLLWKGHARGAEEESNAHIPTRVVERLLDGCLVLVGQVAQRNNEQLARLALVEEHGLLHFLQTSSRELDVLV